MALIYCKKHGETSGNPYVSKLLQQAVLADEKIDYVRLKLDFYDDDVLLDSVPYFLAKSELPAPFEGLGVVSLYDESDEQYSDSLLSPLLEGGGVCDKCFKEWLIL